MINTSLRTRIKNDKISSELKLHLLVGILVLLRASFVCVERERGRERERERIYVQRMLRFCNMSACNMVLHFLGLYWFVPLAKDP